MFLLSCGRSSVNARDIERDAGHEAGAAAGQSPDTFAAVTPMLFDQRNTSTSTTGTSRDDSLQGSDTPFRRLDHAMSHYDSMAVRLKSTNRTDFPSLWADGSRRRSTKHTKKLTMSSSDADEVPIPDLHVGLYQYFCQPQTWSPVFASPGDFTIRIESVVEKDGEVVFQIAVICCSVSQVKDGAVTTSIDTEAVKRKSFVKLVERTERELTKFSETMALKYLGHRLSDKLPTLVLSVLTSKEQLREYGEAIASFLCYVLHMTEIGYNRLVTLTEHVAKNLFVREFLDLSLGFGDHGMISTSSCDARVERRAEDRPLLPSAWFDILDGTQSKSFSALNGAVGNDTINISRYSDSAVDSRLATSARDPGANSATSSGNKCIQFIKPSRWQHDKFIDGAFTVEITGVTISESRAKYTICVLYFVNGQQEMTTVDRRFSEFDTMVNHIESKLRALPIRNHFPTKTLFRSLSVSYLERRAAYLQRFLERLLQMRFLGVLDQKISMVAEPNVRKFLQLPVVQWSITPWPMTSTPRSQRRGGGAHRSSDRQRPGYPESPSVADSSPMFTHSPRSSGSLAVGPYDTLEQSSPHYDSYIRGRSGSM